MFLVAFLISLIGSVIAGLWDLKTTEIPDEIPALMASIGIIYWLFYGLTLGNFLPLFLSVSIGTLVLLIGWLLYMKGQWGGGDAVLLASIIYLLPNIIFIRDYIFNLLLVSAGYMIIYAILVGNKKIFSKLIEDLKKNWKIVILPPLLLLVFFSFMDYYIFYMTGVSTFSSLYLSIIILGLMIFWRYAIQLEKYHFRKRISVKYMKEGDVPVNFKEIRGATKLEVKKIQKKQKTIIIKEGVRLGPVFFINLILTLIFGNLFFILLGL